jgi:hypothetical protein
MKPRPLFIAIAIATTIGAGTRAFAGGTNDFFGSSIGGSPDTNQGAQTAADGAKGVAAAAGAPGGPPPGDYTSDEKRVQKKYKENLKHAQSLILKGEDMMRSHDEKVAKKGKVLKEIGEKAVADLKSNNPFPEIASSKDKKTN